MIYPVTSFQAFEYVQSKGEKIPEQVATLVSLALDAVAKSGLPINKLQADTFPGINHYNPFRFLHRNINSFK